MKHSQTDITTVLLVCAPGLDEKSLYTAVNAIPRVSIIAKAADVDSALRLAGEFEPEVLLANAGQLQDELLNLLDQAKEKFPEIIRIVITVASMKRNRYLQTGADFVVEDSSLDRELSQILDHIETYKKNRPQG